MVIRGTVAKEYVTNKIIECFGKDFVGIQNNKIYVNGVENGERVQIALALTCPKVGIEVDDAPAVKEEPKGDWDWTGAVSAAPAEKKKVEITPEEKQNIEDLMKKLHLI